jgi:hypothetical protein
MLKPLCFRRYACKFCEGLGDSACVAVYNLCYERAGKIVPRAERAERFFAAWAARGAAQAAKLSQRRTSKKQKVLQRSNPLVSKTFVSFGLLAGAPALETDVKIRKCDRPDSFFSLLAWPSSSA